MSVIGGDYSFLTWIVLVFTCLFLFYLYMTRNYNYWSSKGIPQTKPIIFVGSLYQFLRKPMHEVELKWYLKYGRIFGSYESTKPYLYVAEPRLLKDIMVKDFHIFTNRRSFDVGNVIIDKLLTVVRDQEWKRIRTTISPTFTSGKMRKMALVIKECASNLVRHGTQIAEKGEEFNCRQLFISFTLDVIASVAFGTKIDSTENPDHPFIRKANKFTNQNSFKMLLFFGAPSLCRLLKIEPFSSDALNYFKDIIMDIIKRRKETNERGNDFLQLMIDAQERGLEETEDDKNEKSEGKQSQLSANKTLSMDEMLSQCVMFFFAGFDTTATPISLISYNLALNPTCQDKLLKEVDEVWEKHGDVDFDIVMKMPYLDAVICESHRITSVTLRTERQCKEDYKLGDTGIVIPKGMIVCVPIHAMLHDPEWFPEPEKFDPERFSNENRTSIPPFTYIPFGEGPRNCIAERFATMEIKLCLVYLLRHLKFMATEETKKPLEYYIGQPFVQPKKVILKLVKRS